MIDSFTIYRYRILIDDADQQVHVPYPAKVLHVGAPAIGEYGVDSIDVWIQHPYPHPTKSQTRQIITFNVYGTGHPVPPTVLHVGTVVMDNPRLVWHVYINPRIHTDE